MEKEALAVVFAVKHFRFYLLGKRFSVITDNNALRWLHSLEPKGRIALWIMDLQEFEFDIQHRPGKSNQNADALSRLNHSKLTDIVSHITLSLDTNLLEAQRNDPDISKVIEAGLSKTPNICMEEQSHFAHLLGILGPAFHKQWPSHSFPR